MVGDVAVPRLSLWSVVMMGFFNLQTRVRSPEILRFSRDTPQALFFPSLANPLNNQSQLDMQLHFERDTIFSARKSK
jgi:hypothetical protein